MKALRTVEGNNYSWDWDKLIPSGAGISMEYVDTVIDQVNAGIYAPFFEGKHDLTFLDIGANLGFVSIYAAAACKRIEAVEPAPNVWPILNELTRPFNNITCWNVALEDYDGEKQMFINDINFTASSTVNTYGKPCVVPCKKLGTLLKEMQLTHVDVCKVDCEGCEGTALDYYALKYASDIIESFYIECHNCPITTWEYKMGMLVADLSRCGYKEITLDNKDNRMAIVATRT